MKGRSMSKATKARSFADRFRKLPNLVKDPHSRPDVVRVVIAMDDAAGQLLVQAMDAGLLADRDDLRVLRAEALHPDNPHRYASFWGQAMGQSTIGGPHRFRPVAGVDSFGEREYEDMCCAIADALDEEADAIEPKVGEAGEQPPTLTKSQRTVLQALDSFTPEILASAEMIADAMDAAERLSTKTIYKAIDKLVECGLAERPDGERQGARLTLKGRRLAKITA